MVGAGESGFECFRSPSVLTGDHEADVGIVGGDHVERIDEQREVLARLDRAQREDVAVAAGDPLARDGIAGRDRIDAVGHDVHAVGVDGEHVDDLCGHELRHGVHVRPSTQRTADEVGVLQRVARAQLGIADERQVVHGDEFGRAPAGGTTKFGPWTTSTLPVHHVIGGQSTRRHN